jgi:hypothetical protein
MMSNRLLYPLESVGCFVDEDLVVYKSKNSKPDLDTYSHVGHLSSEWVGRISKADDNLLSELIYWKERE